MQFYSSQDVLHLQSTTPLCGYWHDPIAWPGSTSIAFLSRWSIKLLQHEEHLALRVSSSFILILLHTLIMSIS